MKRSTPSPKARLKQPPRLQLSIHPTLATVAVQTFATLAPPPELTISQWADAERYLSPEASAEPGRWSTDRAEYQRGLLDAISDPSIPVVVCIKAAQVGWTECINNTVGFFVHQD